MDDLSGLSWSNSTDPNKPPPMSSGLLYPNVRPGGTSGRSTPISAAPNRSPSPSKPAASIGDSFANLVSFGPSPANKNLSLLEQQKQLQEEKAKKEAANRSQFEAQYGGQNSQFWDSLEQGRRSPAIAPPTPQPADDDDILAAFNAAAPVDASTHFPVPSSTSTPQTDTNGPLETSGKITMRDNTDGLAADDDDPFGLNQLKPKSAPAPSEAADDDDFLGLLGKPVSEIPRQAPPASTVSEREDNDDPMPSNEVDRALAELVDMGFPTDKARQALRTTDSGTDIQAAVGWLLTQAHAESGQKPRPAANGHSADSPEPGDRRRRDVPSWMREDHPQSADKDTSQIASQFGNNLLKTANSLWKTGSKRFQQAVNEFNADHDPNHPRWMRGATPARDELPQPQLPEEEARPMPKQSSFTDEALLLETGDSHPPRKPARPQPAPEQPLPAPVQQQQPSFLQRPSRHDSKSRLSRFAAEEQSAQAYVSPARRKRPQAPPPESNIDLFDSSAPSNPTPPPVQTAPSKPPALSVRPKAPPRAVPPVSQEALQSTHRHREKAAEAYKRGDYAAAHQSFSTALGMLPGKHPITIIIRSNRAMTGLKIGEPKSVIDDADSMLGLIGPSRGESEMIELGNGEPSKPMKDFYGKALMRKAEALEQLERWGDAAQAWKLAVELGHGGSTSIQGRNRCEKAVGFSKPTQPVPARKKPAARKKATALSDLSRGTSGSDSAAVSRLRAANQAAERADEEKFALSESVDARIAAWKNGKQDNLRALLGSLDTVLWPEAGWKKINMSELVLPSKVKIQYMKGIAKVHPDKVCIIHFLA